MRHIAILLAIACGISTSVYGAGAVTIFDIPLDQPFTVPQCAQEHPSKVTATCWTYTYPVKLMPESKDMRSLHFANPPAIGYDVTAFVHAGVMDIVTIQTIGIRSQDYVMSQLIEKFGKPTRFEEVKTQNRLGAQFIVDRAVWDYPQYYVRFDADGSDGGSHEGSIEKGWISIETQRVREENAKKREQALKARQRL